MIYLIDVLALTILGVLMFLLGGWGAVLGVVIGGAATLGLIGLFDYLIYRARS